MDYSKILSAISEVALFIIRLVKKSNKDDYENNRLKEESDAADTFESKFNPHGLSGGKSEVSGNNTNPSKRS